MNRKWLLLLVCAVGLAALALLRILPPNSIDFALGCSVGLSIGAFLSWIAERGA